MTSFISELLGQKFQSYKYNDRTDVLPNFKAVGQTHTELHSLKVEILDVCIRFLFTNLVTHTLLTTTISASNQNNTCQNTTRIM